MKMATQCGTTVLDKSLQRPVSGLRLGEARKRQCSAEGVNIAAQGNALGRRWPEEPKALKGRNMPFGGALGAMPHVPPPFGSDGNGAFCCCARPDFYFVVDERDLLQ